MKILIISSNLIGDTILSTGIIENFSKIYPKAKFTFITGPSSGQIYKNFPSKEKIILIKKKKYNIHWINMYLSSCFTKWDIVIDFRSSLISYFLRTNKKFIFKKQKNVNHLEQLKKSFKFSNFELFIHTNYEEDVEAHNNLDESFKHVVIFPGGNWKPKIWPANYYNELISSLNNKFSKIKFVIVGSSQEKRIYLNLIKNNLPDEIFIDLMGSSLTTTSAYMKKSNLFIGNDSGLMHLSVASNLKTIGLFGPTNDKIYGHKNKNSFIIRTKQDYSYFKKNNINQNNSYMHSIKTSDILDLITIKKLL